MPPQSSVHRHDRGSPRSHVRRGASEGEETPSAASRRVDGAGRTATLGSRATTLCRKRVETPSSGYRRYRRALARYRKASANRRIERQDPGRDVRCGNTSGERPHAAVNKHEVTQESERARSAAPSFLPPRGTPRVVGRSMPRARPREMAALPRAVRACARGGRGPIVLCVVW